MRFKDNFHARVTNFHSRLSNCIYLESVKPVGYHLNNFQGNNFPTHYRALNTIFKSFHNYAKISNIFNYDGQNF